jgi:hypothetical protein
MLLGLTSNWITLDDFFMLIIPGYVQGGALNRGLFFADPLPSLLGAVSGKISEIR